MTEGTLVAFVMLLGCNVQSSLAAATGADPTAQSLFAPIASVLTHPRCLNCHTTTDYPTQGMDRHRHLFLIVRGTDNQGASVARCTNCHQDHNQEGSGVPGAPHWQLAPLNMAWEQSPGVAMSPGALCHRLLDRTRNGDRDLDQLEQHFETEPLVQWAWAPGIDARQSERAPPPLSQSEFLLAFRAWKSAGAPCPD